MEDKRHPDWWDEISEAEMADIEKGLAEADRGEVLTHEEVRRNTKNMEEATLKIELIDKIEHADFKQLKDIYGLLVNYFNSQDDITEGLDLLPGYQKQQILKGLEEAEAGLGTPAKEVIQRSREKYGLNG